MSSLLPTDKSVYLQFRQGDKQYWLTSTESSRGLVLSTSKSNAVRWVIQRPTSGTEFTVRQMNTKKYLVAETSGLPNADCTVGLSTSPSGKAHHWIITMSSTGIKLKTAQQCLEKGVKVAQFIKVSTTGGPHLELASKDSDIFFVVLANPVSNNTQPQPTPTQPSNQNTTLSIVPLKKSVQLYVQGDKKYWFTNAAGSKGVMLTATKDKGTRWVIERVSTGYHTIRQLNTHNYLVPKSTGSSSDCTVGIVSAPDGKVNTWTLTQASGGIKLKTTAACLENGKKVVQYVKLSTSGGAHLELASKDSDVVFIVATTAPTPTTAAATSAATTPGTLQIKTYTSTSVPNSFTIESVFQPRQYLVPRTLPANGKEGSVQLSTTMGIWRSYAPDKSYGALLYANTASQPRLAVSTTCSAPIMLAGTPRFIKRDEFYLGSVKGYENQGYVIQTSGCTDGKTRYIVTHTNGKPGVSKVAPMKQNLTQYLWRIKLMQPTNGGSDGTDSWATTRPSVITTNPGTDEEDGGFTTRPSLETDPGTDEEDGGFTTRPSLETDPGTDGEDSGLDGETTSRATSSAATWPATSSAATWPATTPAATWPSTTSAATWPATTPASTWPTTVPGTNPSTSAAPTPDPTLPPLQDIDININPDQGNSQLVFPYPVTPDLLLGVNSEGVLSDTVVVTDPTTAAAEETDAALDETLVPDDGEIDGGNDGEDVYDSEDTGSSRWPLILLVAAVVLVIGIGGYYLYRSYNSGGTANGTNNAGNALNASPPNAGGLNLNTPINTTPSTPDFESAPNATTTNSFSDGFDDFANVENIGPPPPSTTR